VSPIDLQAPVFFDITGIELQDYVGTGIDSETFVLRSVLGMEKYVAQIQQPKNCDAVHTF